MSPPRLTARSVVLSVLLGAHPAWATAGHLVALTADFGISETALRVALTRMVAAGDLVRSADGYRLADRLLARQRRQDDALHPETTGWDGDWLMCVVTGSGAAPQARAALRADLRRSRFGELRDGVWLRPDNLVAARMPEAPLAGAQLPGAPLAGARLPEARVRLMRVSDEDPAGLASALWDLPGWADVGRRLLAEMDRARDVPGRFTVAAAMVRHLLTDPVLPADLLPARWPGAELRQRYADFAAELAARRDVEVS